MAEQHSHKPNFGKRVDGCPRCEELKAGAEPVRTWSSFFSFSTSEPLRPMMMPGRAVAMVMRARFTDRSMSMRAIPA